MLDICQKWEGLSSFYFVIDPGAIFFVVPYFSVGYLTSRPGLGRPTRPGGVRGRGTTHCDCQLDPVQNRSIVNILQVSKVSKVSKYRKYRKYRSIVDTWLGIGIDAAQVPRYLQSIEYRPGTSLSYGALPTCRKLDRREATHLRPIGAAWELFFSVVPTTSGREIPIS